jgi:hypothetical protein
MSYSNIHVGAVPPPSIPPATNAQQQILASQIQKSVEGMVEARLNSFSVPTNELMTRMAQCEQYLAMVVKKLAEDAEAAAGRVFTAEESRTIALFQQGIISREEARAAIVGLPTVPVPEKKPRKKRTLKEEFADESGE